MFKTANEVIHVECQNLIDTVSTNISSRRFQTSLLEVGVCVLKTTTSSLNLKHVILWLSPSKIKCSLGGVIKGLHGIGYEARTL